MNCEAFINNMDDFFDAALPRAARQKLEEHLAGCRDCRERIRSLQSLLCQSASLPRTVKPEHDLWPEVARKIRIAGNPERVSIQKTIMDYVRASRWTWRLAAAAVAGIMILSAVTRLTTHPPVSRPAPVAIPVDRSPAAPEIPNASELRRRPPTMDQRMGVNAAGKSSTGVSERPRGFDPYSSPCRCDASSDILDLIDKAFLVNENLPSDRAAEVTSERLFKLAEENEDNFFLFKASLEVLSVPYQVSDSVRNRYRRWLDRHPNDPGAIYLYAYSLYGKNTPEMIRLMQKLLADNPDFPWPNLVLAKVYGHPNLPAASRSKYPFFDADKLQMHLIAFMKLCPDSPEPIPILVLVKDPEFLADTVRRMTEYLSARRDTRSLLMYPALWYLGGVAANPGD